MLVIWFCRPFLSKRPRETPKFLSLLSQCETAGNMLQYNLGFVPNAYRYNVQTSIALVPALLALAGYGGHVVMGTFMVGTDRTAN